MKNQFAAAAVLMLVAFSALGQGRGYSYVPFGPLGKGGSTYEKGPEEKTRETVPSAKPVTPNTDAQEREASVKSPTKISGCDAGLMVFAGQYKCKSLVAEKEGGTMAEDPDAEGADKKPSGATDTAVKAEPPSQAK